MANLLRAPVIVVALLLAAVTFRSSTVRSDAPAVVVTDHVRAELRAGDMTDGPDGRALWFSLRFDLKPGWHTYWRNPGDSGEPTQIQWRLPGGIEASDILWPPPKRVPYGPLVNFGYEGRVDHLVRLAVPPAWPADRPLELEAEASWLVCEEICIPEQGRFRLSVVPGAGDGGGDSGVAAEFDRLRAALPMPAAWPSAFRDDGDRLVLSMTPPAAVDTVGAYFFPFEWGLVEPAGRQELTVGADGRLDLALVRGERAPEVLDGVLVLSQRTPAGVVERAFQIGAAAETASGGDRAAAAGGGTAAIGLARATVLALLGGLILNLMPCVFPVLSVKAIGLIHHSGASAAARRASGLAYALGVLSFMLLVAGLLILLKAAGSQVGWGFQLQSPGFVSAMAVILFVLGLSLAGWFSFGASVMGWGSSLVHGRSEGVGSFLTGALAALVSTPCTAPFMGAAIGFAMTQPWTSAVVVMLALGLGLALPYLAFTWMPGLARLLPRPGPWMERLKQAMAFPLFASAAWLVWVLAMQVGPPGVLALTMALVVVAFAIWLAQVSGDGRGGWRLIGRGGAVVLAIAAAALALIPETMTRTASGTPVAADMRRQEPFSPQRLADLRTAGTPVFVNMTAAWCITCKLNEQVALSSQRVLDTFARRGVVYLKGDWTNRDPDITRFLEGFGRNGVPLYVIYHGDGRAPVVLPQLLTEAIVLDAIAEPAPLSTSPSTTERNS
jgi:thiol:disulfide interchange protein DsbD